MRKKILFVVFIMIYSFLINSCALDEGPIPGNPDSTPSQTTASGIPSDYRQAMRDFVINISRYAKKRKPGFLVVPQNGEALISKNGEDDGQPVIDYLNAIDGQGREDLYYGYKRDNTATPKKETVWMSAFLRLAKKHNVIPLVTDYCSRKSFINRSYQKNNKQTFLSFAAQSRELDRIATYPKNPYRVNSNNINRLADAKNFLYLINPGRFKKKVDFLNTLQNTNYDLLIIDLFTDDGILTTADLTSLKRKKNGGRRKVVAYMSIGEAEDYRFYWKSGWGGKSAILDGKRKSPLEGEL